MNKADLLIKNASIWHAQDQTISKTDNSILIHDGKILRIGKEKDLASQYSVIKTWDAGGKLLMPGFINTHCHLFQVIMRGLGKDLPLLDWTNKSVRSFMPLLDEEAIYLASMIGCLEAIRSGTTTLVDFMYAHVKPGMFDGVLKAFDDCGIRGVLAHGITDLERLPGSSAPTITYAPVQKRIEELDCMRSEYKDHPRVQFMLAPSVIWGMSRDGLAEIAQYAQDQDVPVTMHILETGDDDKFSLNAYGMRTVPLLEEVGILDTKFLAVHAIQLQDEDIELFKRYNSKVSYNTVANMILGSGVAPIPRLSQAGIQIGLGTDGAGSNDSQNMFELMKSSVLLQKVHHKDPTVLSANQVFSMATSQGAAAIFQENQIGSLSAGMKADILVIDLSVPNTTPCYEPIASLVYSGNDRNINSVFIEGKQVMENGKFTNIDEEALVKKTQEKGQALYKIIKS